MKTEKKANKKTEGLTDAEFQALKDFTKDRVNKTMSQYALDLGVTREVLIRVLLAGSGSPKSVSDIRTALKKFGTKQKRENKEIAV